MMETESRKILIAFDAGALARVERERLVTERATGKRPPRTAMLRTLINEAMDTRCVGRGEEVPAAVLVGEIVVPVVAAEAEATSSEESAG